MVLLSTGKPPQGFAKREFSDLRPNSTEQPTSSHTPLVPGLQTLLQPAIPAPLQPLPPSRPTSAHLSASASGNSQQQQQHHQQQLEVLNDSLPARPPSFKRGPSPTSGPTPATDANEPLQHTVTGGNGGGGGLHGGSSHRGSMPPVHSNRVVPLEGHVVGQASEGAS